MRRFRLALTGVLLLAAVPAVAHAQLFLASKPHPGFEIGPLFVRATVTPELGPVAIDVTWSVSVPANRTIADLAQDVTLLWPGGLAHDGKQERDPALVTYVTGHGFKVIDVWESEQDFNAFLESRLNPAIQQIGIEGQPKVEFIQAQAVFNPQALAASRA